MVLGPGDDDAVDQDARDLDLARVEAAALRDALDLDDDDPAGVVRGHGDGKHLQDEGLPFHRHVAIGIGSRAADDPDVDRKRLVEQVVDAADWHQLDELFGGAGVELAAAESRVDEGAQTDAGKLARLARCDVAVKLRDHALRQVVRLDPVGDGQLLQLGYQTPVTAYDAPDEPFVAEVVQTLVLAVALPCSVDEGEIAGAAHVTTLPLVAGRKRSSSAIAILLGKANADEATGCDRVAVSDQPHRIRRRDDLAPLGVRNPLSSGWLELVTARLPSVDAPRSDRSGQVVDARSRQTPRLS